MAHTREGRSLNVSLTNAETHCELETQDVTATAEPGRKGPGLVAVDGLASSRRTTEERMLHLFKCRPEAGPSGHPGVDRV